MYSGDIIFFENLLGFFSKNHLKNHSARKAVTCGSSGSLDLSCSNHIPWGMVGPKWGGGGHRNL